MIDIGRICLGDDCSVMIPEGDVEPIQDGT